MWLVNVVLHAFEHLVKRTKNCRYMICGGVRILHRRGDPIHVIYYYVIWTDNGIMLPEVNIRRQEGKYLTIEVLQGCILKLLLHSVNSEPILYRTSNMQTAIFLSFVTSSSLPSCGLQSIHPRIPCNISPYVVYNVYRRPHFPYSVTCCTRPPTLWHIHN